MIQSSRQLKALVRNMSKGDSSKAQIIIRNYIMECFLERLSLTKYQDHLVIKGGILVSALVGLDNRSTMDVDAMVKNLILSAENAEGLLRKSLLSISRTEQHSRLKMSVRSWTRQTIPG